MNQDPVRIRTIDWGSALPDLNVVKALRFAYRCRTIVPALAAVLLVGLLLSILLNVQDAFYSSSGDQDSVIFEGFVSRNAPLHHANPAQIVMASSWQLMTISGRVWILSSIFIASLLVALTTSVAISRGAASEFCLEQRSGAITNLRYTASRWSSSLIAALAIAVLLLLAFLPLLFVKLAAVLGAPEAALTFGGTVVAVPAFLMWQMLVVTWPLAAAAIAVEDCGPADAISRAISYILSHKLRTIWLVVLSVGLANLAGLVANQIMMHSALLIQGQIGSAERPSVSVWLVGLQRLPPTLGLLRTIVQPTVQFAVLQSAFTISYLLLRRTEDGVSYREFGGTQGA